MTLEEYELYELIKPSFIQNVNFSTEAKHRDPVEPLVQGRNGIPHEEKDTPIKAQVICGYNITNPEYGTTIYSLGGSTGVPIHDEKFSEMEIDGILQDELDTYYEFDTAGKHTVKFTLIDPTDMGPSFAGITDLVSVTIPDTVTAIDDATFDGTSLTSVIIPANITRIGNGAFHCQYLTNITFLPDVAPDLSVLSSGSGAFESLPNNGTLTIPDNDSYDEIAEHFEYLGWTIVRQ